MYVRICWWNTHKRDCFWLFYLLQDATSLVRSVLPSVSYTEGEGAKVLNGHWFTIIKLSHALKVYKNIQEYTELYTENDHLIGNIHNYISKLFRIYKSILKMTELTIASRWQSIQEYTKQYTELTSILNNNKLSGILDMRTIVTWSQYSSTSTA